MRIDLDQGFIDTTTRTVTGPSGTHDLREKEARVLEMMAAEEGGLVTREQLLVDVFGYAPTSRSRTLATTISRTRSALSAAGLDPDMLQTVYGEGYRWVRTVTPDMLPATGTLVGRAMERARLSKLLADRAVRVVGIVGVGGVGKTTLARALAHHHDAPFVDLVDVRQDLPEAVAEAIGGTRDATTLDVGLSRTSLLVLDNLEQLVDDGRKALAAWVVDHPRLRVVYTSRVALGVPGESVVSVAGLQPEDARELFQQRSSRSFPNEDIDALCLDLAQHPLSIELAARRTQLLDPSQLRERLRERSDLLRDDQRCARHRSLGAVAKASMELLPAETRAAAEQIAALASPQPVSRLLQVVRVEEEWSEDLVQTLLDHHLLQRLANGRVRLHPTTVAAIPVRDDVRRQVEDRYLDAVVEEVEACERGEGPPPDHHTLVTAARLAMARSRFEEGALVVGLAAATHRQLPPPRFRPFLDALVEAAPGLPLAQQARIATARSWMARNTHSFEHALPFGEQAVRLARRSRDDLLICRALVERARSAAHHPTRVFDEDLEEATWRHDAAGRTLERDLMRSTQARRMPLRPDFDHARACGLLEEIIEQTSHDPIRIRCQASLAQLHLEQCDLDAAWIWNTRCIDETRGPEQAWHLLDRSFLQVLRDQVEPSMATTRQALAQARDGWMVIRLLSNLDELLTIQGAWAESRDVVRRLTSLRDKAPPRQAREANAALAGHARRMGDLATWHRLWNERTKHPGEPLPEQALALAQEGRLADAVDRQQTLVQAQDLPRRRMDAEVVWVELLVAQGRVDEAIPHLQALLADPRLVPLHRPRLQAVLGAAEGEPREVTTDTVVYQWHFRCWDAVAYERAGRLEAAQEARAEVLEALTEAGLPMTSELGWYASLSGRQSS